MKRLPLVIVTIVLSPLCQSIFCQSSADDLLIRREIEQIEKRIVDLTAPSDLFSAPEFVAIYENPIPNTKRILTVLSRDDVSESQKLIAAFTMQRLPLDLYITFLKDVLGLCRTGKVTPRVFEIASFPSYDWNCYFADNYKSEKVKTFLKEVKSSGCINKNWAGYVDEVLSGKAYRYINKVRNTGQVPACQRKAA